ncbi:EAL domain-containing protein [Weissella paramesenteroides]|nr:EAL domain-containing protein [Weissella paramesenteroides]
MSTWSFVNGGQNLNQQQIYWTIKLLRSLTVNEQISLVVEGVEEEMVSYWLLTMNVHNQQGFLFAKPEKL